MVLGSRAGEDSNVRSGNLGLVAQWNGTELDGLVVHSGRLTLRPWQLSDAPAVQELLADERMRRPLMQAEPYTAQDATNFVAQQIAGRTEGLRLDCAVAENTTGRLIGSASLALPVAERTSAEIGYWIGVSDWGAGYATEATRTLARFGFGHGLSRIQISCAPSNIASASVALKAGFGYEAFARALLLGPDGQRQDAAVFARTAADSGVAIAPAWPALTELTDGTLTLRPVVAEDWPSVLAEVNNPESLAWGFGDSPFTEAQAQARCAKAELDWLVAGVANLLLCDAATGAGAGILTLRREGPPGVVGIGYGVLPEFRGRRFTTRALGLVSEWAFGQAGVTRLELGCKTGNVASARSAEAAGFVREGLLASRLRNPDGSFSDEIGFGKVRPASHGH
jgi:RimJ/RimL family protein N-acetyltransferase